MKTLLLMRHAKSSWAEPGMDDHERPLNARGRAAAPFMGRLLRDRGYSPDVILCSSAQRALDTARLVASAANWAAPITILKELYLATPGTISASLRNLADGATTALVVGHNPGLEELVESLSSRSEAMPTAAVARFQLALNTWAELVPESPARLLEILRPKELE